MNEEELAFSITAQGLNSLNHLAELRKVLKKLQRLISSPFFKDRSYLQISKKELY